MSSKTAAHGLTGNKCSRRRHFPSCYYLFFIVLSIAGIRANAAPSPDAVPDVVPPPDVPSAPAPRRNTASNTGASNAALLLTANDLRLTQGADGGYHLYIRKKPGISSLMLCETTRDPALTEPTYAYRALEPNAVNGEEKRVLDGRFIGADRKNLYLMDSTPEYNAELRSEVFHIYIPYIIAFGYPGQRNGEVYVGSGTFLNIRAFALPYGDYSGAFRDNPFELQPVQKPLEGPPELNYMKDALDALTDLSKRGGGTLHKSTAPRDIVPYIEKLIGDGKESVDLVIALDTTNSMKNDIDQIKKDLPPLIKRLMDERVLRVGFVLFRDYREQYLTRLFAVSSDIKRIETVLAGARAAGGGDIPEAVHEALYDAAVKMEWYSKERYIILITDAPPHLRPRGKIKAEDALDAAKSRGIIIHTILLPQ
ncbi:MAG: VWA domain-containing protein [Spirochaetaceae bacterium]|jgi:hypothetical protein|nr:VWA domain-containing protein [Spirochaetaceae bacterium]